MFALQSIRRSIPAGIRAPLRSLVARLPFSEYLLTSDFTTLTPDTPPAVETALAQVAEIGLPGDYYEFGLYRGYTFWRAQQTAKRLGLRDMKFFGFDSFEGLPETLGNDAATGEFKQGNYACSRSTVNSYLNRHGIDWARTHLIEGFFDQSITPELKARLGMRPAAVVLIDCDLYESMVPVLNFIVSLVQPGTILLFDDWNCFHRSDAHGERKAVSEFMSLHPQWIVEPFISFGWHGQAFTMRTPSLSTVFASFPPSRGCLPLQRKGWTRSASAVANGATIKDGQPIHADGTQDKTGV